MPRLEASPEDVEGIERTERKAFIKSWLLRLGSLVLLVFVLASVAHSLNNRTFRQTWRAALPSSEVDLLDKSLGDDISLIELATRQADASKSVVFICGNAAYADMLVNLLYSLHWVHQRNIVIGALDEHLFDITRSKGLPSYKMYTGSTQRLEAGST